MKYVMKLKTYMRIRDSLVHSSVGKPQFNYVYLSVADSRWVFIVGVMLAYLSPSAEIKTRSQAILRGLAW